MTAAKAAEGVTAIEELAEAEADCVLSRDQQRSRAESTLTGSLERRVPSHEAGYTD